MLWWGNVWEWVWRIVESEEREVLRSVSEAAEKVKMLFPHPVDDFFMVDNYWMSGGEELVVFDLTGIGKVEEVIVKAPSKNFTLTFQKDMKKAELTYDRIEVQTQISGAYFALRDMGEYVVGLKEHAFLTNCKLVLKALEDMVFTRIYAKWNMIKWIGASEK